MDQLIIEVPEELKKRLKILAIEKDISLKQLVTELIVKALA